MPKNQNSRKGRRTLIRRGPRSTTTDPSFTHVLSYVLDAAVTSPANGFIQTVFFSGFSGFPQLSTFFEMAQPVSYRLRMSYTNWNGTAAYVPMNPLNVSLPSLINTDPLALLEVRGSVRLQSGFDNTGVWCRYPYTQQGFQTYYLQNAPGVAGYIMLYNDASTVANWTIQMTIEVKVRFFRRTLYAFTVSPTLTSKFVLPPENGDRDDDSSADIVSRKSGVTDY
jgi:hypothetical protein